MTKFPVIFFLPLLLVLLPQSAGASGIAVSPAKLEIFAALGKSATSQMWVKNPGTEVQIFEVYADEFAEFLDVNPNSFTLEPQEQRSVAVRLNEKFWNHSRARSQILQTELSVLSLPLKDLPGGFTANAGVKIPVTLEVRDAKKNPPWARETAAAVPLLLIAAYLIRRYYFTGVKG